MHGRVALQQGFDLAGIDVLAGADEHVVGAPDKEIKAVRVAAHDVIGPVPAVAQHLGGRLGQVGIALHDRRAAHLQYTLLGTDARIEPHLVARQRIAEREIGGRQPAGVRAESRGAMLGRAVAGG